MFLWVPYLSPPLPKPGRMEVDLQVDPVSLGWYSFLHVQRRVMHFISNLQTKLGKKDNITSRFSSESDLEKVFFLYESRVIYQSLKPEQIKKYKCIDGVMSSELCKYP